MPDTATPIDRTATLTLIREAVDLTRCSPEDLDDFIWRELLSVVEWSAMPAGQLAEILALVVRNADPAALREMTRQAELNRAAATLDGDAYEAWCADNGWPSFCRKAAGAAGGA